MKRVWSGMDEPAKRLCTDVIADRHARSKELEDEYVAAWRKEDCARRRANDALTPSDYADSQYFVGECIQVLGDKLFLRMVDALLHGHPFFECVTWAHELYAALINTEWYLTDAFGKRTKHTYSFRTNAVAVLMVLVDGDDCGRVRSYMDGPYCTITTGSIENGDFTAVGVEFLVSLGAVSDGHSPTMRPVESLLYTPEESASEWAVRAFYAGLTPDMLVGA